MSRKIAEIYNTVLSPSKEEIINRFLGTDKGELDASWRLLDPEGEVGIESLITRGDGGEYFQLPLTYRAAELSTGATLCTLEHGVLGRRWVSASLKDPTAVQEILATILRQELGALPSQVQLRVMDVRGVGVGAPQRANLDSLVIEEVTATRCAGTLEINSNQRRFVLTLPQKLVRAQDFLPTPGVYTLEGEFQDQTQQRFIVATLELF